MAYSDNFPATRPVFMADFANGGRIDPRATFSRSDTPPTYAAPSAVHYWSNEKHLSSENLLSYSDDVSQSNWIKDGLSETGGQTAPDGGTDAYKLTENTANDEHRIYQASSERITSSGSLTVSVYLKYIGRQWAVIRITDSTGTDRRVWFDIQNGTKGTEETNMTGSITASGNGYYKCVATISSVAASPGTYVMIGGADADNSYVYTGSGADAFAVWGIQASTTGESVLNETSGQIHREYAPTLKSVATAGQPRFEYDPASDGQSVAKGILIESQAQNLNTYSEDFSDSGYTKVNSSIQSNAAIAPDGTLTADLLVEDGGTSTHAINKTIATGLSVGSTQYAVSIFAKAAGRSKFRLFDNVQAGGFSSVFDLSNGTVESGSGTIEDCGNGWYRCTIIPTANASTNSNPYLQLNDGSGTTYTGNGYSGLLLWGLQLETGNGSGTSHSSSYIGTTSSTATRAAESLSMATSGFGFAGGPVSMQVDFNANSVLGSTHRIASIENTRGLLALYISGGGDVKTFGDTDGTTAIDTSIKTDITANTDYSMALRWDTNDYRGALNGTLGNADTSCPLPDFDGATLYVGGQAASGVELDGHCKRIAVWGEALSDSNLQAITS